MTYVNQHNMKAILLLGGCRNRLAGDGLDQAFVLWPMLGRPVCERMLCELAAQGLTEAVVLGGVEPACVHNEIGEIPALNWRYERQDRPAGTAGSLREMANQHRNTLLLTLLGISPGCPDIGTLLHEHTQAQADLTVLLAHPDGNETHDSVACAFLCRGTIIADAINGEGYMDIKETLLPALIASGRRVHTVRASHPVVGMADWRAYREAVFALISGQANPCEGSSRTQCGQTTETDAPRGDVQIDPSARIAPSARLVGPIRLLENVHIAEGATVIGPAVLERGATIGAGSLVVRSILWPGVRVGLNCVVRDSVLAQETELADRSTCVNCFLTAQQQKATPRKRRLLTEITPENAIDMSTKKPLPSPADSTDGAGFSRRLACMSLLVLAALIWSHWSTLSDLLAIWLKSDEYSSGLLVPLLAAYLVYARRSDLASCAIKPALLGILALLAAEAFRVFGLLLMYGSAVRLALVLAVIACVFALFGGQVFRRIWPVLLFLLLMLPLPKRVESTVTVPLQSWATSSAVFCLETLGYPAVREGNIIHIGDTIVAVAEACNGLRMISGFLVICALIVLLIRRSWWVKAVLLASALPIALLCNTVRLSLTSIAFTFTQDAGWREAMHDYGGYAMMPLALACICAELALMKRLIVSPDLPTGGNSDQILVTRQTPQRCRAES